MTGFSVEKITERYDEEIRFFKSWMKSPKAIRSAFPASPVLASRMAGIVNTKSGSPALEPSPGKGTITKAILHSSSFDT